MTDVPISNFPISNKTAIRIELPEGFEYINGDLKWTGTLTDKQTVQLKAIVRSIKSGNWKIKGWVEVERPDKSFSIFRSLYVSVSEDGAITGKKPISPRSANRTKEQTIDSLKSEAINIPSDSLVSQQISTATFKTSQSLESTITITGYWKYNHQNGSNIPVRYQKVILKEDVFGTDPTIDTSYTANDGKFTFTNVPAGKDLYVEVHATFWNPSTAGTYITDGNIYDISYWSKTSTYQDVNSNLDMGTWIISDAEKKGAWHIYDKIVDGYLYLLNQVNDRSGYDYDEDGLTNGDAWNQPKVEVIWPEVHSDFHTLGYHIHLESGDAWTPDVILHEYGHAVMHKVYDDSYPSTTNCSPHEFDKYSSYTCAFTEGWATFVYSAIENSPSTIWGNLESGLQRPNDVQPADQVEGEIAGILWDIFDPSNEGQWDSLYSDITPIWDVLIKTRPDTVHKFWDSWKSEGYNEEQKMWAIYYNHGIDKDVAEPSPPYLTSPSGTINDPTPTLIWDPAIDDLSGIDYYQVQVDDDISFQSPWPNTTTSSTSFYVFPALNDGTYYWHVRARDNAGKWGPYSVTWSFTVDTSCQDTSPPPTPTLYDPGLTDDDGTYTVDWSDVTDDGCSGLSHYELQEDDSSSFPSPTTYTTSSSYYDFYDKADGMYYYRVKAVDNAGNAGNWSGWVDINVNGGN